MNQITGQTLGWIGLGRMGFELAKHLAQAGANIAGYNRTRSKAEPLAEIGVQLVEQPVDLRDRDIVFTMVSTADALRQVLFSDDGLFSKSSQTPKILADFSTISEEDSQSIREAVGKFGTELLVVPVSGNDVVARAQKLRVLASGPKSAFDTVRPFLECLGPSVTYVGEGDSSRIVKIGHNLLLGIIFQGLVESTILAEKHGVPRHIYLDLINNSVLGSLFTRYKSPGIVNLDFTVTFTQALLGKDLDLGLNAAEKCGAALPLSQCVKDLVQNAIDAGDGETDFTTLLLQMAKAANITLQSEQIDLSDGLS